MAVGWPPQATIRSSTSSRQTGRAGPSRFRRSGVTGARPHHSEMITALAFWPDGKLLASASLDSTVRLWSISSGGLLGTLTCSDAGLDWVVYTPDGLFDGSQAGERRVAGGWTRTGGRVKETG